MKRGWGLAILVASVCFAQSERRNPFAGDAQAAEVGRGMFRISCSPCHGIKAQGGRGPDLTLGVYSAGDDDAALYRVVTEGVPGTEMPAYGTRFGEDNVWRLVTYLRSIARNETAAPTGNVAAGEQLFWSKGQCGQCHRVGDRGGRLGPELSRVGRQRSLAYLRDAIVSPNTELTPGYATVSVETRDGKRLRGVQKSYDNFSAQFMDANEKLHSFLRSEVNSMSREFKSMMPGTYGKMFNSGELDDLIAYMVSLRETPAAATATPRASAPAVSDSVWTTYGRNYAGWRFVETSQISKSNVAKLTPAWTFQTGVAGKLEASPLVFDGLMYFTTAANQAFALDASTGKLLWQYAKPIPRGVNLCCGQVNRGFATLGNVLYKVNLEATLVAIDAKTGATIWETQIEDIKKGYSATLAPLVVKNLVLIGIAGAEYGVRSFIDAYDAGTGKRVWRFWTVPGEGEPGVETWGGTSWQQGGGSTWITGTYDPELNLTYWGTGNPGPDLNGDDRPGDNLYTCALVALDADTGKLKWHYQFTPHDVHDWDAVSDPVLVDLKIKGQTVKSVLHANRNGFFYALDRTNGKLLVTKAYTKVTWADSIGPDGRPRLISGQDPTEEGNVSCPGMGGGHNWQATTYSPSTGLYYFNTTDGCHIYYKTKQEYVEGMSYQGSTTAGIPTDPTTGAILALDPTTGDTKWRFDLVTPPTSGLLATGGGLVFGGDGQGYVFALDADTGRVLWKYQAGGTVIAPPISYVFGGKQYVAVAAGQSMLSFALP